MIQTSRYYDMASLSEAAYVDFSKIDFSDTLNAKELIRARLQDKENYDGSFSATQAQEFVDKWEVVSHQANTENGFSATLFRLRGTDEYYYVPRGSEVSRSDWVSTDYGDIFRDGLAIDQIIDMYNDIQRIKGTEDAAYDVAYKEELVTESVAFNQLGEDAVAQLGYLDYLQELRGKNDLIVDGGTIYAIKTDRKSDDPLFLVNDENMRKGLGKTIDPNTITATGHSLGGHLATAFTRLFAGSNSVAINGAGFATGSFKGTSGFADINISNLFSSLGGVSEFSSTNIQEIYGDQGIEATSMNKEWGLVQPGSYEGIYIERWFQETLGHGKSQMTDSLAVYDLFFKLDPRFQTYSEASFKELFDIFMAMENGRDGDDWINGVGGADHIDAGAGNDFISWIGGGTFVKGGSECSVSFNTGAFI